MAKPISLCTDRASTALLTATNKLLCLLRSICHTRLKPLNLVFSLRLQTLHLCRDGKLVTHSHSHIPSPSALGVQLPTLNYLLSLPSLCMCSFTIFPITLKTVKTSNTFTPGSGYPVVLLFVCNETKTKTTGRVHRAGMKDRDQTEKHTCADFTRNQVPTSQVYSRRRLLATVQILHSSPRFLDPQSRALQNESWKSRYTPLELCGSGGKT